MANTLLESYKGRLAIAEKYFAQKNNGAKMTNEQKMLTAVCLNNTAKYLNEAFNSAVGTQRSDLGAYKIFCMDITTLVMPNLIVNDLFLVQPMASFSGNLVYMSYGLGQEKGGVGGRDTDGHLKTVTNNPWMLGKMDKARAEYTGERVVERVEEVAGGTGVELMWQPVNIEKDAAGLHKNIIVKDLAGNLLVEGVNYTVDDSDPKHVKIANGGVAYSYKVGYIYDNVVVPQDKLPTFVGEMKNIPVAARARRIAIVYSQIAAFQA